MLFVLFIRSHARLSYGVSVFQRPGALEIRDLGRIMDFETQKRVRKIWVPMFVNFKKWKVAFFIIFKL